MHRDWKAAFTLIELLVVIAIIAILAAILFPVFAQARDRARMSSCLSNMRQIGTALTMYVQDYDETYPDLLVHGSGGSRAARTYTWRNAIRPYLKNVDVYACPSNPFSRGAPGVPNQNAEGWVWEPGERLPISYGMNSCTTTFIAADTPQGRASPPLRLAQVTRPVDTLIICESNYPWVDVEALNLWIFCPILFTHPTGKRANFIFYDGHAKSKKWMDTLYPVNQNNWELTPNPDPNNRKINGAV